MLLCIPPPGSVYPQGRPLYPGQRIVVQMPGEVAAGGDVMASLQRMCTLPAPLEPGAPPQRELQVLQLPDMKVGTSLLCTRGHSGGFAGLRPLQPQVL